jgi:hypothetical protein
MSRCSAANCLNGNCQGCRNGTIYCNDPRCYPNCPECASVSSIKCASRRDNWEWGIIVAIISLAFVAILLLFISYYYYMRNPAKMIDTDVVPTEMKTTEMQTRQTSQTKTN